MIRFSELWHSSNSINNNGGKRRRRSGAELLCPCLPHTHTYVYVQVSDGRRAIYVTGWMAFFYFQRGEKAKQSKESGKETRTQKKKRARVSDWPAAKQILCSLHTHTHTLLFFPSSVPPLCLSSFAFYLCFLFYSILILCFRTARGHQHQQRHQQRHQQQRRQGTEGVNSCMSRQCRQLQSHSKQNRSTHTYIHTMNETTERERAEGKNSR